MAKKTASEKADKTEKPDKGGNSADKGAGDKTPVENVKENEEQPVELGKYCCLVILVQLVQELGFLSNITRCVNLH